jgi:hypothetical protein
LAGLPSQFPKPVEQVAIPQAPAAQTPAAFAGAQTVPHAPQFAMLAVTSVSHPFAGLPSQFPHPASQAATAQLPEAQADVACASAQAFPHAPQFAMLAVTSVSQPFPGIPSQFPHPGLHGPRPQLPPAQAAVPFVGVEQAFPHAPQWATFVRTSASQPFAAFPSQFPKPVAQVAIPQAPAAQTPVAFAGAQVAPHAPQ